jgi:tetratricopeptide (TPR) repeat protein
MNSFISDFKLTFISLAVLTILIMPAFLYAQTKDEHNHRYWFEKGSLLSVYGNQDAAIEAFEKAIEIKSDYSEAFFHLGIAYAEKDHFEKALAAINRAIEINPDIARYHYGRGWVHIRFGNRDNGILDMQKAAAGKHPDAIRYIENIAPRGISN